MRPLVDAKQILRLGSEIDRQGGPHRNVIMIIHKLGRIDFLESVSNVGPRNNFRISRRNQIMLHGYALADPIIIDAPEPSFDPPEKFDPAPAGYEILPMHRHPGGVSLFQHQPHIHQYRIRFLRLRAGVHLGPELPGRRPDVRDELRFLHIPRRQGAVKIINNRQRNDPVRHTTLLKTTQTTPHSTPFPTPTPTPRPPIPPNPPRPPQNPPRPPLDNGGRAWDYSGTTPLSFSVAGSRGRPRAAFAFS